MVERFIVTSFYLNQNSLTSLDSPGCNHPAAINEPLVRIGSQCYYLNKLMIAQKFSSNLGVL